MLCVCVHVSPGMTHDACLCSEEFFWTDGNVVLQCTSSSFTCASIVRLHPNHLPPTHPTPWRSLYVCPLHITAALARCEL